MAEQITFSLASDGPDFFGGNVALDHSRLFATWENAHKSLLFTLPVAPDVSVEDDPHSDLVTWSWSGFGGSYRYAFDESGLSSAQVTADTMYQTGTLSQARMPYLFNNNYLMIRGHG